MTAKRPPAKYVGAATVAKWIGVAPKSISVYRARYADTDHPCPEPDVVIAEDREVPGWLESRKPEWLEWAKSRPGQGVGGGRPPKDGKSRTPASRKAVASS